MKRRIYLAALVCLGVVYLYAGIGDLIVSFAKTGKVRAGYLLGAVAWLGVGVSAVLLKGSQRIARFQDSGPVVQERDPGPEPQPELAFVFRTLPARRLLRSVALSAYVAATLGNIAIGRTQSRSSTWQLVVSLTYDAALGLILWSGLTTSQLSLTERGVLFH